MKKDYIGIESGFYIYKTEDKYIFRLEHSNGKSKGLVKVHEDEITGKFSARILETEGSNNITVSARKLVLDLYEEMNRKQLYKLDFEHLPSKHVMEVAIGKDEDGETVWVDIRKTPHLLIAGTTGSGKSVAINSLITQLLMNDRDFGGGNIKFCMIDPKQVELIPYRSIDQLSTPLVTNALEARQVLESYIDIMEKRYNLLSLYETKNIEEFNLLENKPYTLPYHVVVIDELAELMMTGGKEVESSIVRLAQKSRAVGIHLILATQRPTVDVVTGLIKANVPSRMAFGTFAAGDSRVILDEYGAEKLLGNGDGYVKLIGERKKRRFQGYFITGTQIDMITETFKSFNTVSGDIVDEIVIEKNINKTKESSKKSIEEKTVRFLWKLFKFSIILMFALPVALSFVFHSIDPTFPLFSGIAVMALLPMLILPLVLFPNAKLILGTTLVVPALAGGIAFLPIAIIGNFFIGIIAYPFLRHRAKRKRRI